MICLDRGTKSKFEFPAKFKITVFSGILVAYLTAWATENLFASLWIFLVHVEVENKAETKIVSFNLLRALASYRDKPNETTLKS